MEENEEKQVVFCVWIVANSLARIGACQPAATEAPATEAPAPEPEPTEPPAEAEPEPEEAMAETVDCSDVSAGDEVSILYQWSGAEEENFSAAIAPVVDELGISVTPESSRDQALLDTRVQAGTPWDIIIWPTIGPSVQYTDELTPLADAGADPSNYEDYWISLGTAGGAWLAVPVKADIKSIIWYSSVAFDAFGYSVPTTLDELDALVEQMVVDGNTPWSMGMESGDATGWTGSDYI